MRAFMKNIRRILKVFWWFVLVIVIGLFCTQTGRLISGKPTYFDSIVLLYGIGICRCSYFSRKWIYSESSLSKYIQELKKRVDSSIKAILKTAKLLPLFEFFHANNNQIYVIQIPNLQGFGKSQIYPAKISSALAS